MMKKKINKSDVLSVLEYIIVILFILDVYSVWLREYELGDSFFRYIAIPILIVYILIAKKNRIGRIKQIISVAFIALSVLLSLISRISINYIVRSSVEIGLGFSLTYYFTKINLSSSRKSVLAKYSDIVFIISLVSLFFYFFGSTLQLLPGKMKVTFMWGGKQTVTSYYNIYFESQKSALFLQFLFKNAIIRNCACFTEAPMYAYILSLALTYEVLIAKKIKLLRVLILGCTIVTTTSTTGIAVVFLIIALFYLNKMIFSNKFNLLKGIGLIGVPFVAFAFIFAINLVVEAKQSSMLHSYNVRLDDVNACLGVFLNSPLWGCGLFNYNEIINAFSSNIDRASNGLSSGLLVLLAQTGITLASIPIINVVAKKHSIKQYEVLAIFICLYTVTNVPYQLVNIVFVTFMMLPKKYTE